MLFPVWSTDAVPYLPGEVESLAVVFQLLHHPQALLVVVEGGRCQSLQGILSHVSEGGMPQVVAQGHRLGEVLVEVQGPGDGAGYLADLQGMGEPGAVMVALGSQEYLRLMLEAAKGLAVDDAVAVAHETGAQRVWGLLPLPAPAVPAAHGVGGEPFLFPALYLLA